MQAAQPPSFDSLVVGTATPPPSVSEQPSPAIRRTASVKKLHGAIAGTGSASQEALLGLASGLAFGLVTPVVGHPGDVIKTQLQANTAHQHYTTTQTIRHIYRAQGLAGFYKGFFPPLVGTALTRGILFSTYSGVYSACSHSNLLSDEIPFTAGLGLNVVLGGIAAGSARAIVETPLEFIKVRSIVGKSAAMDGGTSTGASFVKSAARDFATSPVAAVRHMYHGFVPTLLRSVGVCGSFFVLVDYSVRFLPDVINSPYGAFFKGGVCATAAWTLAFPFETAKSVIQADSTGQYRNMRGATTHVLKTLYQERGLKSWYRGFVPGAGRSFIANGCSMMVYSWFQDAIRDHFNSEA